MMVKSDPFRIIHLGALALCLVFLPWSTALLSISQIILVANWIAGGIVKRDGGARWGRAFGSAPSLLFIGFWGLHVLGLLWTSPEGMGWGMDLVRILLPVLVFGVVLGGSPPLSREEFRTLLLLGAWSVIASSIVCMILRGGEADYRRLSAFISHIRLALLLCMSIAILLHYARGAWWKVMFHLLAVGWAVYFLDRLGSIQAFVILMALGMVWLWHRASLEDPARKWTLRIAASLPVLIIGLLVWSSLRSEVRHGRDRLPHHSARGEAYEHVHDSDQRENGELVWAKIAWGEVVHFWPKRSKFPLDSLDAKGHPLQTTLFRYLASKGLPKDSTGIMSLTEEDVRRIEAGTTNHLHGSGTGLADRAREVMFEVDEYLDNGRVSGHSVTMRLEFWKAGLAIFRDHWLLGVGTGDTQVAFDEQYERMRSGLSKEWRLRAHDQYLTIAISFGSIGLLAAALFLILPATMRRTWRRPLFVAWVVIIGIGSITDDTIETQAGATFFALYYALFVLAAPHQENGGGMMRQPTHEAAGARSPVADRQQG